MPHKRTATDGDIVLPDPVATKKARKAPPEPSPVPEFHPKPINNDFEHGYPDLPANIDFYSPVTLFNLFFSDEVLASIADHTNLNAKIVLQDPERRKPYERPWHPVSVAELKAYIATYIWMGCHGEKAVEDYWCTDARKVSPHIEITSHIGRNRWEQIDRFLHISKPQGDKKTRQSPYDKLEPLSSHLRRKFKQYWKTGKHIAIDETIQRFMGRAWETVNIPTKPTPEGYKIWVLAQAGYVLDWLYHIKGDKANEGPVGLDKKWTYRLGFSRTEAVVLQLMTQCGLSKDKHIVWLDNLFTTERLLTQLREEGFGAAGTIRLKKTVTEEKEETSGTQKQKKKKKEPFQGIDSSLADLKIKYASQIPWGRLYGKLSKNKKVMHLAWKDQNVVLFMTTVSKAIETILRKRKRPSKTSTHALTSRVPFGEKAIKELLIPLFIDQYNHFMNGVDIADQLRAYYTTQRTHVKTWKPLWHFLLDTTITNCWKLYSATPDRPHTEAYHHDTHKDFRNHLANGLFDQSERVGQPHGSKKTFDDLLVHLPREMHGRITKLANTSSNCSLCVKKRRYVTKQVTKRKTLGELSVNTTKKPADSTPVRPGQYPKGRYGCALCGMYLCDNDQCFDEHLDCIM